MLLWLGRHRFSSAGGIKTYKYQSNMLYYLRENSPKSAFKKKDALHYSAFTRKMAKSSPERWQLL